MIKINSSRQNHLKFAIYLVLSVGFISAMAMSIKNKNLIIDENKKAIVAAATDEKTSLINSVEKKNELTDADKQREQESKDAFIAAYKVFMHPRCMNCHPAGDIPLQGDDSRLHPQGVKRGADGKGLFALKCKNCHQDTHVAGEHMPPGHSGWHLPPANLKMVFEGKTPRQLAMHFKDSKFTGFKTMDKMLEHVEKELLVTNSWTYGTPPPLSHSAFVEKVKEWIEKGAAIPYK